MVKNVKIWALLIGMSMVPVMGMEDGAEIKENKFLEDIKANKFLEKIKANKKVHCEKGFKAVSLAEAAHEALGVFELNEGNEEKEKKVDGAADSFKKPETSRFEIKNPNNEEEDVDYKEMYALDLIAAAGGVKKLREYKNTGVYIYPFYVPESFSEPHTDVEYPKNLSLSSNGGSLFYHKLEKNIGREDLLIETVPEYSIQANQLFFLDFKEKIKNKALKDYQEFSKELLGILEINLNSTADEASKNTMCQFFENVHKDYVQNMSAKLHAEADNDFFLKHNHTPEGIKLALMSLEAAGKINNS